MLRTLEEQYITTKEISRKQRSIKIKQTLNIQNNSIAVSSVNNTSTMNLENVIKTMKLTAPQKKKWKQVNQDDLQRLIREKDVPAAQRLCKTLNFREKKTNKFLNLINELVAHC